MRTYLLLLLSSLGGVSQSLPLDLGVTGGIPMSETLRTYQYSGRFGGFQSESATRRYVAGGTVGARLNASLSLKVGVLYRRFGYDYDAWGLPVPLQFTHFRGTGASWEMPILMKWSVVHRRSLAPYVALGATYRRLASLNEIQTLYNNLSLTNPQPVRESSSDQPDLLKNRNAIAPTAVAGLEFRVRRMFLAPEIRYTRWHTDTLGGFGDPIRWNWQRVDFLFGIGFSLGRH
ncbi:MAG: hypothetical protein LAQ69_45940 [Acidobacteriia bacterium]|nr:hypothetical protein [Terriglobia bacterium]